MQNQKNIIIIYLYFYLNYNVSSKPNFNSNYKRQYILQTLRKEDLKSPDWVAQLVRALPPIGQGCEFNSQSGYTQESTKECINK